MPIAAKVDGHTINEPKPTIWNAFAMQPNTLAKLHVTIPNATMVLYSDISYGISLEKKNQCWLGLILFYQLMGHSRKEKKILELQMMAGDSDP